MKPLVSILIPTYNRPHFLEQALKSALDQTYPNIEIIICDNSDDDTTKLVVQPYLSSPNGSKIKYIKHKKNIGPIPNQQMCLDLSAGEYINYLMDDDLLHPKKIQKMIKYLIADKTVALVTSRKMIIDESGKPIKVFPATVPFKHLNGKKPLINGKKVLKKMLHHQRNYIGEPTTPLFRKKDLKEPFGTFLGYQAMSSVDAASWMSLLTKKNAVYLSEPLSSFRKHSGRLAKSKLYPMARICDWIVFTVITRENGLFKNTEAFVRSVQRFEKPVLHRFIKWNRITDDKYVREFIKRVRLLIKACKNNNQLNSMTPELKSLLAELKKRKEEKRLNDLSR
jgi:glycosyltransferase involved in cell wall biosynthesis